jgi:hypothetical protein
MGRRGAGAVFHLGVDCDWLQLSINATSESVGLVMNRSSLLVRHFDLDAAARRSVVGIVAPLEPTTLDDGLRRVFRVSIVRTKLLAQQEA